MTTVSIVMPMHNSEDTLGGSVESVLAQTYQDWELLIVDDRSTDGSAELARQFAARDSRIRVFSTVDGGSGGGAAPARNLAIEHAQGRFIAFLDSDDLWLPTKLEKQVDFTLETGAPLTYTDFYRVEHEADIDPTTWAGNDRVIKAPAKLNYNQMSKRDYIGCLTAMYDTEHYGKRFMPLIERRQDYGLWLALLRDGEVAQGISEPLAVYRTGNANSLSGNKIRAARFNWILFRHVEGWSLPRALWNFGNYAVRSLFHFRK